MRVTLIEDGIYGKKGEVVELGAKKAIELGLVGTKTTTEENEDEVVVTTKLTKHK